MVYQLDLRKCIYQLVGPRKKYETTQLEKIPRCCRFLLCKNFCDQKVIVMDDEKYFTFSHSTLTGMDGFWTEGLESCLKIYKDLKISENSSKIHELF
jgi:hypothetical protein